MILCVSSFISRPSEIRFAVTIVNFTGQADRRRLTQTFCSGDPLETGSALLRASLPKQSMQSLRDIRICDDKPSMIF